MLVDVSIDQGGCFETSRPTTHSDPTYEVDGIIHYCVANMPGAVPITSTCALTNATMPYVVKLADRGRARARSRRPGLPGGLNVAGGKVTYEPVARDQGRETREPAEALGGARRRLADTGPGYAPGSMFWLWWKTFSGSHARLSATSRP